MSVSNPPINIPIAYLSSQLPCTTETFVYREVLARSSRGWTVCVASLHDPAAMNDPALAELAQSVTVVYGTGFASTVRRALLELAIHPRRSIGTIVRSWVDAMLPGEPTSISQRTNFRRRHWPVLAWRERCIPGVFATCIVTSHSPTSVGMYAAIQLGIPFSFTGHANDLFQRRTLLVRKLQRASFVACISQWHEQFYRQAAASATPSYQVIRCGVDVDGWKPRKAMTLPAIVHFAFWSSAG